MLQGRAASSACEAAARSQALPTVEGEVAKAASLLAGSLEKQFLHYNVSLPPIPIEERNPVPYEMHIGVNQLLIVSQRTQALAIVQEHAIAPPLV